MLTLHLKIIALQLDTMSSVPYNFRQLYPFLRSKMSIKQNTKKCEELLENYHKKCQIKGRPHVQPIKFDLESLDSVNTIIAPFKEHYIDRKPTTSEITFYNPTKIIDFDGTKTLALRVEPKSCEDISHVLFFQQNEKGLWSAISHSPHLHLQDPFYIENIHGFQILGGVEVFRKPNEKYLSYRTSFYRYKDEISEMDQPFAYGPKGMKDIRLIELKNGKIAVFTRPQGDIYGRGKIAYLEINHLSELNEKNLQQGTVIEGQFAEGQWGGVNDLQLLDDGRIGVLGHIAHYAENKQKNYYAMTFVFDPKTKKAGPIEIIASAEDVEFKIGRKKESLGNIIFSGGLHLNGEKAKLYAGINDVQAVCIDIANPFSTA